MTLSAPPSWHALVLDDEPWARLRLRQLLTEMAPALGCVAVQEAASAAQALALLEATAERNWLVFADIHMPAMDGLQFAQRLQQQMWVGAQRVSLIFVSAHDQHALAAFELAALDYLSKPVRRERLLQALNKAMLQQAGSAICAAKAVAADTGPTLWVEDHGQRLALPLHDLVYVQAQHKYLTLHSATRSWLMNASLRQLEQDYAPLLLRIHRHTLVHRGQLLKLTRRPGLASMGAGWQLHLRALSEGLPVSRRQLSQVQAALAGEPHGCA